MKDLDHFAAIVAAQIRAMGMSAENARCAHTKSMPIFGINHFDALAQSIEGRLSFESQAAERLDQIRGMLEAIAERGKRGGAQVAAAELRSIWELAGGQSDG